MCNVGVGHSHPNDSIIEYMTTENNAFALAHRAIWISKNGIVIWFAVENCEMWAKREHCRQWAQSKSFASSLIDCCVSCQLLYFVCMMRTPIVMRLWWWLWLFLSDARLLTRNCVNSRILFFPFSMSVSPHGGLPYLSPNSNRNSIEFGVIYHTIHACGVGRIVHATHARSNLKTKY